LPLSLTQTTVFSINSTAHVWPTLHTPGNHFGQWFPNIFSGATITLRKILHAIYIVLYASSLVEVQGAFFFCCFYKWKCTYILFISH
jgi:hypothetical protein